MGVFIGVFSGSFFLGFVMGLVTALVSLQKFIQHNYKQWRIKYWDTYGILQKQILLRCGDYFCFAGGGRERGGSAFMPELAKSVVLYYIWIWSLLSISVPRSFDVHYEHFVVLDP